MDPPLANQKFTFKFIKSGGKKKDSSWKWYRHWLRLPIFSSIFYVRFPFYFSTLFFFATWQCQCATHPSLQVHTLLPLRLNNHFHKKKNRLYVTNHARAHTACNFANSKQCRKMKKEQDHLHFHKSLTIIKPVILLSFKYLAICLFSFVRRL